MKLIDFILRRKPEQEVVDEVDAVELDELDERFLETMSVTPDYDFRIEAQFDGGPLAKETRWVSGGQRVLFIPFDPTPTGFTTVGVPVTSDGKAIAVYRKSFVGVYSWIGNITPESFTEIQEIVGEWRTAHTTSRYHLQREQKKMEESNVG